MGRVLRIPFSFSVIIYWMFKVYEYKKEELSKKVCFLEAESN